MGQYKVPLKCVFSILFHSLGAPNNGWSETMYRVVMLNRFPRVFAAIFVGAALALAGAAYQGVFRNPLVSPDILGVSSGSCVGAAIAILLKMGHYGIMGLAFAGGILAVGMTLTIPRIINRRSTVALVLSGVVVGGFFSSALGLLKYLADPDTELAEITYWQLGSLAKVRSASLSAIIPIILVSGAVIVLLRWRINVLSLGDKEARVLGADLIRERGVLVVAATLLTAASICLSGTISWIGLVMPHLARMISGQENQRVIPVAALLSAVFLLVVDTAARNLTGAEIPLSIITGFLGTPFFTFVLIRQKNEL
jgi:iron complex transport system permease protein